jgi:predicted TIM-barrel fold metal-dependent hydrolase
MASGKIDTHQHFFPKPYLDGIGLDALARQMPNQKASEWSPERAIATIAALMQVASLDHVLFGTDFPMAPGPAITQFGHVL